MPLFFSFFYFPLRILSPEKSGETLAFCPFLPLVFLRFKALRSHLPEILSKKTHFIMGICLEAPAFHML